MLEPLGPGGGGLEEQSDLLLWTRFIGQDGVGRDSEQRPGRS